MQERLQTLRKGLESPHSTFGQKERAKAVQQLPPHEHIVALVKGLDRDPRSAKPWTGDSVEQWLRHPERCVRRAVSLLEHQMRMSLTKVVEKENRESMSPAWRERDFLLRVFQRADKKRHGRYTGDCDIEMFMAVWGSAPEEPKLEPLGTDAAAPAAPGAPTAPTAPTAPATPSQKLLQEGIRALPGTPLLEGRKDLALSPRHVAAGLRGDGAVPDDAALTADAELVFKRIDKNGDGSITLTELVIALRKDPDLAKILGVSVFNLRREDGGRDAVVSFFQKWDVDHDKKLSMLEFSRIFVENVGAELMLHPTKAKTTAGEEKGKRVEFKAAASGSKGAEPTLEGLQQVKEDKKKKKGPSFEQVKLLEEVTRTVDGKTITATKPKKMSQAAAAAVFVKYGYDREGYMPYEVFIKALLASPSRLLGMEPIMDAKERDRHGYEEGDDFSFDGKIIYPKCRLGVFPPSEFDPENVVRSSKAPSAELELEHVYGYAGLENTAPNLYYLKSGEVVYYTAAVGVVLDKDKLEKKQQCQRFFFGHDDDIKCLAIHPNREWVATGQLGKRPFVCVWDGATCQQLQKITHPAGMRGVIALGFSRHDGGAHLTAVNSDNAHTVMVWRWSKRGDDAAVQRAKTIPGWSFGPAKRMDKLAFYESAGGIKKKKLAATAAPNAAQIAHMSGGDPAPQKTRKGVKGSGGDGDGEGAVDAAAAVAEAWKTGPDGSYELVGEGQGMNGLPPVVYGCAWNPFEGMEEFVTYGAKHIKVWRRVDGQWLGEMGLRNDGSRTADVSAKDPEAKNTGAATPRPASAASRGASVGKAAPSGLKAAGFDVKKAAAAAKGAAKGASLPGGNSQVALGGENVVSAVYVRQDVIVTGFPSGALGVWLVSHVNDKGVPADPRSKMIVKWGASMVQRIAQAHDTGPRVHLNDGTTTFGGVRCLCLRADGKTLLSGGADGWIHTWEVADGKVEIKGRPMTSKGKSPVEKKAVVLLRKLAAKGEKNGPHSFQITSPYKNEGPPAFRALDCRPPAKPGDDLPKEFVMGTNRCDVWEVEYKLGRSEPVVSVQVYGHLADLYAVAAHPTNPDIFASSAEADRVFLWNAADRNLLRTSPTGLTAGRSVAFSMEPVPANDSHFPGWKPMTEDGKPLPGGHHLAVGGKHGRVAVMDGTTLQPLAMLTNAQSAVDDLKYCGGPRQMLAAGSHDLVIDIYDVERGYVHLSRCQGHQATVTHLDWSLPLYAPNGVLGAGEKPQRLLQSNCASYEILYWDPLTGRQVLVNQRDTQWESFTCVLGFPVMGIWPDGSDGTDVNAVDRAAGGQSYVEDVKNPLATLGRRDANDSCAGLKGASYLVTSDDFGKVKLFNYPCVFNDAPYREYKGHASHAMCVRFTSDDSRVITAGGHDRAMLQFKTRGIVAGEKPIEKKEAPRVNRRWGPIDGGKAYGWMDEPAGGEVALTAARPAAVPAEKPAEKPARPAVEPAEKPAEKPARPAVEPAEKPAVPIPAQVQASAPVASKDRPPLPIDAEPEEDIIEEVNEF